MKDIFITISSNKKTFEDFRKWLFNKLNKNQNNFRTFGKYPTSFKLPYLLQYLESKKVNILSALVYYNALSSCQANDFNELCVYLVICEFKRIELNKKINYVPF